MRKYGTLIEERNVRARRRVSRGFHIVARGLRRDWEQRRLSLVLTVLLGLLGICLLFPTQGRGASSPKWPTEDTPNAVPDHQTGATSVQSNTAASPPQDQRNISMVGATNSLDSLDDKHRLAIGDRLSFRIVEDEEDPKQLSVTDSGDLEVPYLGRFAAEGRTCRQLARELKAELEREYYYRATVIIAVDVMSKSRGKVYLVGPVRAPGPQEIPSDEVLTLSKAILRAGGFGDYADRHRVRVTRKGSSTAGEDRVFTINVAEILEEGKTESDLPLEPGDLIYVPERLIRF
jgi:protein involved in polysaccharide export with SLBB domain